MTKGIGKRSFFDARNEIKLDRKSLISVIEFIRRGAEETDVFYIERIAVDGAVKYNLV